jgi:hypothetical protein
VAVLDVGTPTAEAAPSVSPFAGTYVGRDPLRWSSEYGYLWTVTISDGGRITGSYSSASSRAKGSISGRVSADGSYSFTVSRTTPWYDEHRDRTTWNTSSYKSAGSMESDPDGNIVGTDDTGNSFDWLRQ